MTLRAHADREHAYLEVEDDGPGVPAEHAPHVFERFYRAEGERRLRQRARARDRARARGGDGRRGRARVAAGPDGRSRRAAVPRRRRCRRPSRRPFSRENGDAEPPLQCDGMRAAPSRWSRSSPPRSARRPCSSSAAPPAGSTTTARPHGRPADAGRRGSRRAARRRRPLLGNGFDPARIYASRSPGRRHDLLLLRRAASARRARASSSPTRATSSRTRTWSRTPARARDRARGIPGLRRLRRRRPDSRLDRRLGPLRRRRRRQGRPAATTPSAPVPLGDSSRVVVGEPVAAIGSPFGQESSLAVGVVSATERSITSLTSAYDVSGAIQIDAPINHGNSGGPLLDARGRVIGINAQIRSDSGNAEGVGFAIPINSARRSMEQLISTGQGRLRVRRRDHAGRHARRSRARYELGAPRGALIQTVSTGAPAGGPGCAARPAQLQRRPDQPRRRPDRRLRRPAGRAGGRRRPDRHRRLLPGQTVSVTVVRGGTGKRETVRLRLTSGRSTRRPEARFSPARLRA